MLHRLCVLAFGLSLFMGCSDDPPSDPKNLAVTTASTCPQICPAPVDNCMYVTCSSNGDCGLSSSIDGLECAFQSGPGYCDKGICLPCTGCDDNDPCTADVCGEGGKCLHYPYDHQDCLDNQNAGFCVLDFPVSGVSTCCAGCVAIVGGKKTCVAACPPMQTCDEHGNCG